MQILICDDEQTARNHYRSILQEICDEKEISAGFTEAEDGDHLLFDMNDIVKSTDIIFMDVGMPGTDGLEAAEKLRENGYGGEIIFLTRSKEAVFYAFDVHANNYLVKDVATQERIEEVFLKAVDTVVEKQSEYILLTGVGEYRNVPVMEIRYFEIMQKIVTVYYGDTSFEFVSTMGKLENLLFARGFVRISRSYLVSIKYIASFSYDKVIMADGTELPVGRKYYKDLKVAMKGEKDE